MDYCEKDLVRIAKREGNKKRSYLVVDPLQGKHVPTSPSRALRLFEDLAKQLKGKYEGEKLLFIGFAETATAIGAHVAIAQGMMYIQTTREVIPGGVEYLFFSEAHSHATEQKLVKDDIDAVIHEIDRIVFVEDEVTTGNTIRNIINVIRKEYSEEVGFAVASLLNGMGEEYLEVYKSEGIDLHYLVKTDHSNYGVIAEALEENGEYFEADTNCHGDVSVMEIDGYMNARRLVHSLEYEDACEKLAEAVMCELGIQVDETVLVIGTEEFMFPALYVGKKIEEKGNVVRCHSTTRSPIAVSKEENDPLHCRYELCSLYDSKRKTFIYDLEAYDRVVVITDSDLKDREGLQTLVNAIRRKNNRIDIVRWC